MPFRSQKQMKACFASKGFGGKVDCDEWAHKTDYKELPKYARKKDEKGFHSAARKALKKHFNQ